MEARSNNCKLANEIKNMGDGQRRFENHTKEIHILCDWVEDDYPIGRIYVDSGGIHIELNTDKEAVPVYIHRSTHTSG